MAIQDLTGKTFGRLKVVSFSRSVNWRAKWLCRCQCGGERVCDGTELVAKRIKACRSCARKLKSGRMVKAHKHRHTKDVDKLTALLDDEGRERYERWQSNCEALAVKVSKAERVEVLRELVDRRAV